MTSILTSTTCAVHSAAATILTATQIKVGDEIPAISVREDDPLKQLTLDLSGKNIIYIQDYDKYKDKGIKEIYIVAVNDVFVPKTWKEKLAPQGTDDNGELTSSPGPIFDAFLGSLRSKRYVMVAQDKKAQHIVIEKRPADLRVTVSDVVLPQIA